MTPQKVSARMLLNKCVLHCTTLAFAKTSSKSKQMRGRQMPTGQNHGHDMMNKKVLSSRITSAPSEKTKLQLAFNNLRSL